MKIKEKDDKIVLTLSKHEAGELWENLWESVLAPSELIEEIRDGLGGVDRVRGRITTVFEPYPAE